MSTEWPSTPLYNIAGKHPGELVAKVGYFGVKSTKVCRAQMGTKPAKVGRLGPRCAKVRRGPHPAPTGASAKRSSIHAASKVAKVGAAGGPKLLKWGLSGRGSNLLKSDRPLTSSSPGCVSHAPSVDSSLPGMSMWHCGCATVRRPGAPARPSLLPGPASGGGAQGAQRSEKQNANPRVA